MPGVAPRRRRGGLVAVILLVVLLLGGAAAGGWWVLRGDRNDTPTATRGDPTNDGADPASLGSDDPSEAPSPSATLTSSPTSSPSAPAGVECWDGTLVSQEAECSVPAGVDGLAWVYPSFNRNDCAPAGHPASKLTVWQCWMETPNGEPVLIRYNEWVSPEIGWASYAGKGRSSTETLIKTPSGRVVQAVWRFSGVNREGRVTLSAMYKDWPFSVSVEGGSMASINEGLKFLVEQRPSSELLTR